jgi:excisionase family DNA binding protein
MAIITSTRESGEHERIAVRIPAAAKMIGISRSRFYELLGAGRIEAVKLGRSTLTRRESQSLHRGTGVRRR